MEETCQFRLSRARLQKVMSAGPAPRLQSERAVIFNQLLINNYMICCTLTLDTHTHTSSVLRLIQVC